MSENGTFRKKQSFAMASNSAIRDKKLSLKAKGLYTLIQSYITLDTLQLTKSFLMDFCPEKETAFNSAWDELKKQGYLKMHILPAEKGRFSYEYDLLDEADLDGGAYLYRHDKNGNITSTNLSSNPPLETDNDHYPDFHPSGKHWGGEHHNGKGGGNIILPRKTKNNIINNTQSINQAAPPQAASSEGLSEEELREIVEDDFFEKKAIPLNSHADKRKMLASIRTLTDWYGLTSAHFTTEFEHATFDMLVECLADMACDDGKQTYKSNVVTHAMVIDQMNAVVLRDGSLYHFAEQTVDDYMKAAGYTEIRDKRKYMKSVIWNSFLTYRVKFESDFARTYIHS